MPAYSDGSPRVICGHAHAEAMARAGVPLMIIQCRLGYANPGATLIYPQGIDNAELIGTAHTRPAPMDPATAGRRNGR